MRDKWVVDKLMNASFRVSSPGAGHTNPIDFIDWGAFVGSSGHPQANKRIFHQNKDAGQMLVVESFVTSVHA